MNFAPTAEKIMGAQQTRSAFAGRVHWRVLYSGQHIQECAVIRDMRKASLRRVNHGRNRFPHVQDSSKRSRRVTRPVTFMTRVSHRPHGAGRRLRGHALIAWCASVPTIAALRGRHHENRGRPPPQPVNLTPQIVHDNPRLQRIAHSGFIAIAIRQSARELQARCMNANCARYRIIRDRLKSILNPHPRHIAPCAPTP